MHLLLRILEGAEPRKRIENNRPRLAFALFFFLILLQLELAPCLMLLNFSIINIAS